jgi:hypothetical protein
VWGELFSLTPAQPVAARGNGFGLFLPFRDRVDLPLVATGCNHGAP